MNASRLQRFRSGYNISVSLVNSVAEEEPDFWDQKLAVQRSDAFEDLPHDTFMALGYLVGMGRSLVVHPYSTVRLWRQGE